MPLGGIECGTRGRASSLRKLKGTLFEYDLDEINLNIYFRN